MEEWQKNLRIIELRLIHGRYRSYNKTLKLDYFIYKIPEKERHRALDRMMKTIAKDLRKSNEAYLEELQEFRERHRVSDTEMQEILREV